MRTRPRAKVRGAAPYVAYALRTISAVHDSASGGLCTFFFLFRASAMLPKGSEGSFSAPPKDEHCVDRDGPTPDVRHPDIRLNARAAVIDVQLVPNPHPHEGQA